MTISRRRLPVGVEVIPEGGAHFRVWAPYRKSVRAVLENSARREVELEQEGNGYFSGAAGDAHDGTLYRFSLDGSDQLFPDPASRFQPDGPHGPSQIVDPTKFRWSDAGWRGVDREGQVIYEMHIGTFTREGTWEAAARELPELADGGITVVELMPVADFAGKFGWGYDGVNLFAPTRLYGSPENFRRFVDHAHASGLGVILDVVYNHVGPDGNYLPQFSPDYFSDRYTTDWGEAINFDGQNSGPVREFYIANAGYWIEEFHLDGLRLDATQNVYDASPCHILREITQRVRGAGRGRATYVVAENEAQEVKLVRRAEEGGFGIDVVWNDDFHHSAMVALTGRNEAYYSDYRGSPQEFISAAKYGYLFQGQWYSWQRQRRGTPTSGVPTMPYVNFIQNHDQIANSGRGKRAHHITSPGRHRAITALMLLMPGTPMLFQGQEFSATSPFFYFGDHKPELRKLVRDGRFAFLRQFPSVACAEMNSYLADPSDPRVFEACKLDLSEREKHAEAYALHRDLLRVRREDRVLSAAAPLLDGAVLAESAFLLRWFLECGSKAAAVQNDRLLIVNLGPQFALHPASEPLLAPPEDCRWTTRWSSEDPRYGGSGLPPLDLAGWRIPAECAVLMHPEKV